MPETYINRDVSWLQFNKRVLEEASDVRTPLLERGKFIAIFSSNLDEFMSLRVAGIAEQIRAGYRGTDLTGHTPRELVRTIIQRVSKMVVEQMAVYRRFVQELEATAGLILFERYDDLNATQQKAMRQYYENVIAPILTPMAVDVSRPFPLVHNLGLYVSVVLRKEQDASNRLYFAIVHIPTILPRLLPLPARRPTSKKEYVFIEVIMKQHIDQLFASYQVVATDVFRLTRNADFTVDEETAEDLRRAIERQLHLRKWGAPLRLEVDQQMHPHARHMLAQEFDVEDCTFLIDGPIDLTYLQTFIQGLTKFEHLRYPVLYPQVPRAVSQCADKSLEGCLFQYLQRRDLLVHHPFESFDAVSQFLQQAAHDPMVLAIKMTLYRVSSQSTIIESLVQAAERGKQVTVIVELKARFDEERNIAWARRLEKAGCHVVYGLVGLKTHAKLLLVIRKEAKGLRRYVHVGTGNYNDATAHFYTDIGLFTRHPAIGEDAAALFNEMTGYSAPRTWKSFSVAPQDLRQYVVDLIRQEAEYARMGRPAHIIAKMNGISHKEIIDELYRASQAGVQIDLIVRGVCCLRPGVAGLSERIRVTSIIDRFLEHSRVFYFNHSGNAKVFISSADWLTRNLTRRIEIMCPIYDLAVQQSLINILRLYLQDNVKARLLLPSGEYERISPEGQEMLRAQFLAMDVSSWKVEG